MGKRRRKGLEHAEKEGTLSADGDDDDDDDDESALRERGREGKASLAFLISRPNFRNFLIESERVNICTLSDAIDN